MGNTLRSIPFIDGNVAIRPHTARYAQNVDRDIKIARFAGDRSIFVFSMDNGDVYVRAIPMYRKNLDARPDDDFICGPIVDPIIKL